VQEGGVGMVMSAEQLAALEAKAEKLRQSLAEKEKRLKEARREISRKEREAARKARAHALIQLGWLVDLVGLGDVDKGALVGGLLKIAKDLEGREKSIMFGVHKMSGDAFLAALEADKADKETKNKPTERG
jgi:DUF4097 and DUF4098 domain-containing protein YvlB